MVAHLMDGFFDYLDVTRKRRKIFIDLFRKISILKLKPSNRSTKVITC